MRLLLVSAIALLLAACGGAAPTPSPVPIPTRGPANHVIAGTVTLYNDGDVMRNGVDTNSYNEGNLPGPDNAFPCAGTADFADIATGAEISIADDGGAVLSQGTLVDDVPKTYDKFPKALGGLPTSPIRTQCYYTFELDDVADAASYTLKVGNQAGLSYSAADLATQNWTVAVTLGL
jgi:hypothetical protein